MSSLDGTILPQSVGTSWVYGVAFLLKQIANLWMIKELPTLIKMHMFIVATRIALREEMRKPLWRRTFGDSCVAMFHASKVVSYQNPTCFTIDALVFVLTRQIIGSHSCEAKVDGQALTWFGCSLS